MFTIAAISTVLCRTQIGRTGGRLLTFRVACAVSLSLKRQGHTRLHPAALSRRRDPALASPAPPRASPAVLIRQTALSAKPSTALNDRADRLKHLVHIDTLPAIRFLKALDSRRMPAPLRARGTGRAAFAPPTYDRIENGGDAGKPGDHLGRQTTRNMIAILYCRLSWTAAQRT
jgi:hypothetical protein